MQYRDAVVLRLFAKSEPDVPKNAVAALVLLLELAPAACAPASTGGREAYEDGVVFADLDLNDQADVDTLLRRIRIVGEKRCGVETSDLSLEQEMRIRQCRNEYLEHSVENIGRPALTSRLEELSGGS